MLVDFTVKNFRSIRDEQTLSFFAQKQTDHFASSIHYPSSKKVGILASAGIYGANASGKTTVLMALKVFLEFLSQSHTLSEGDAIEAYQPFRVSTLRKAQPSLFAVEFVVEKVRYVYEIELDALRVVSERLDFYSQGTTREVRSKLFERTKGSTWEEITFGTYFKGGARKIPVFDNQAYLSKAGNSPDAPELIRKVYQFFKRSVFFVIPGSDSRPIKPIRPTWRKNEQIVKQVADFLSAVDTGISRVLIKKQSRDDLLERFPKNLPEAIKNRILEDFSLEPYFEHQTEDGGQELFSESDESHGTRALFNVLPLLLQVFKNGSVLVWDELEASLHPHVSELVVSLFNNPKVNRQHAQLLFTTHNLDLMDSSKMRKDQLWLADKKDGATELVSLDEFDSGLKSTSPFAKWYDEGRLGGLPAIDATKVIELFESVGNTE
jgi:AAA15 family ATPase/GTPase